MNLIDLLLGEHAVLRTTLDHYEKALPSWTLSQMKEAGRLLESLLMTHGILEDELLFDILPVQQEGVRTTLQAMREEHQQQRRLLEGLRGEVTIVGARRALRELCEQVEEHFSIEERVLFGVAAEKLGEDRLGALAREWTRRRGLCCAAKARV